jgi:hypothetical protein
MFLYEKAAQATNEHRKDTSSRYRDGSAPLSSQASRKMRLTLQRRGVTSRLAHKCIMEALCTIEEEVVGPAICGETAQGQRPLTIRPASKARDGHIPGQQPTSLLQSFEPLKCRLDQGLTQYRDKLVKKKTREFETALRGQVKSWS